MRGLSRGCRPIRCRITITGQAQWIQCHSDGEDDPSQRALSNKPCWQSRSEDMAEVSTCCPCCFFYHDEPFAHVAAHCHCQCGTCVTKGFMFLSAPGTPRLDQLAVSHCPRSLAGFGPFLCLASIPDSCMARIFGGACRWRALDEGLDDLGARSDSTVR